MNSLFDELICTLLVLTNTADQSVLKFNIIGKALTRTCYEIAACIMNGICFQYSSEYTENLPNLENLMHSESSDRESEKPKVKTFYQLPKHVPDLLQLRKCYPSAFLGVRNATDL